MSKRTERHSALRTVRGCLLAVSSAALGTTAHTLADGTLPDVSLTVLLTVLIGWTSTALADKTRGTAGILAVLGTGQLLMHVVLTELVAHAHAVPAGGGHSMTAAHALATAGTAVLLARAESLLLLVAATLRLALPTVWRARPVPAAPVRAATSSPAGPPRLERYLRRAHGRRGPPAHS